jgi:integrase/recombinase XerD
MKTQLPSQSEEYLTWLAVERGRSPRTLSSYASDLRRYHAWLKRDGLELVDVREADVLRFIDSLQELGLAPSTTKRAVVTVRNLHRFLLLEGELPTDPCADVAAPPVPDALPKALEERQIEALFGAVVGDGPRVLRDRAMLEVLYGTGLRVSELVGLDLSDIDTEQRLIRAFGKGAKERVVPVGRIACEAVDLWLGAQGRPLLVPNQWAHAGDDSAVFLSARGGRMTRQAVWQMLKKYALVVDLADEMSPHVLRHSCATHMLEHGADIRMVQEMLGHASVSSTQRYTRISQQHLKRVYYSAHPRAGVPR